MKKYHYNSVAGSMNGIRTSGKPQYRRKRKNAECSLRFFLTRLPQSVFVSVIVQGQRVFVVGQWPSFGRPACKIHARGKGIGNREEETVRLHRFTFPPQWKLFHDPVRPFPHDIAGIFGLDSQARYLSPAIWLILTRLACLPQNRFQIFFRFVRRLLPHSRNLAEREAWKLFLKY